MFTLLSSYGLYCGITKADRHMENGTVLIRRIGRLYLNCWKAFVVFCVIKWLATGSTGLDTYAMLTDFLGRI